VAGGAQDTGGTIAQRVTISARKTRYGVQVQQMAEAEVTKVTAVLIAALLLLLSVPVMAATVRGVVHGTLSLTERDEIVLTLPIAEKPPRYFTLIAPAGQSGYDGNEFVLWQSDASKLPLGH
jgi:hypothetical protein